MFTLPLPVPTNEAYKTGNGHFYKSKEAKQWEEDAGYILLSQKNKEGIKMITAPVYVGIAFFLPDDRKDIDGGIKAVLDLLQRLRIYSNDRLVCHLNVKKFIDKKKPRVEVEVEPTILQ